MDGAVKIWHMGDRADGLFRTCADGDKNSIAADTFGDFWNNIGK